MSLKNSVVLVLLVSLVITIFPISGCIGTRLIEDITPQEAFTLIQENQTNPDFVIIDVRTPEEFTQEYIENALNLNYHSETFQDELNQLDKSKTYLIYCQSGNRSRNALNIMAELNFKEAYNMLGGIAEWKKEGLPTVK